MIILKHSGVKWGITTRKMVIEDRVFEYLKKYGQANTFRLASKLGIDRYKILKIIRKLEEKNAVELKSGIVKFLRFPTKEKEVVKEQIKIKKAPSKPKKEVKYKTRKTFQKKVIAERKSRILEDVKNEIKEQTEHIEKLEKTIKELQQKANLPPKIIRKTIIKKVPTKVKEEVTKQKKEEIKSQRFKIPKFNISWVKNIQQIDIPKFIGRKINIGKPKINFAKLNKNIQQLHVPEMFKKGG